MSNGIRGFAQENILIDFVRNHPCLWQQSYPEHNRRLQREIALQKLAQKFNGNVPVKTLLKKWHNVRTYFLTELRKERKAKDADEPYVSHWKHFDRLWFLRAEARGGRKHGIDDAEAEEQDGMNDEMNEEETDEDAFPETSSPASNLPRSSVESAPGPPDKRYHASRLRPADRKSERSGQVRLEYGSLQDHGDDEEMLFCRSLAASLRALDRPTLQLAKLELQQVVVRFIHPAGSHGS